MTARLARCTIATILLVLAAVAGATGGGSRIDVSAQGKDIKVKFDGRLATALTDDRLDSGAISLQVSSPETQARLQSPYLQSAVLTDSSGTHNLLKADSCETVNHNLSCFFPGQFSNFEFSAECVGCDAITITVRRQSDDSGYKFGVRPWYHFDCYLVADLKNETSQNAAGCFGLRPSFVSSLKSILHEFRPSLILACILFWLITFVQAVIPTQKDENAARFPYLIAPFLGVISLAAFGLLVFITHRFLGGVPHVQDSSVYWFQSTMLTHGWFSAPAPPSPEHWFFEFVFVDGNRWFGQYPFFWPLVLAVGQLLHVPTLVPAVVGTALLVFVYRLGAESFGRWTGLLAALLLLLSPWYQMMSSNFMAHGASALLAVLSAWAFVRLLDLRSLSWSLFAGISLGALFCTRPLTAVGIGSSYAFWGVAYLVMHRKDWRLLLLHYLVAAAAVFFMLGLFLLSNYLTTGSFFQNAYQYTPSIGSVALGWTKGRFPISIAQVFAHVSAARHIVLSWPALTAFCLPLLGIIAVLRIRSVPLLLPLIAVPVAYSTIETTGSFMYGPRYWYEALPFVVIFAAAGVHGVLSTFVGKSIFHRAGLIVSSALLLFTIGVGSYRWWFGAGSFDWIEPYTPLRISKLQDFNGISPRLSRAIQALAKPAIVFLPNHSGWHSYGHGFFLNDPDLPRSKVWVVRDLGDKANLNLAGFAPKRELWKGDHLTGKITPYSPGR